MGYGIGPGLQGGSQWSRRFGLRPFPARPCVRGFRLAFSAAGSAGRTSDLAAQGESPRRVKQRPPGGVRQIRKKPWAARVSLHGSPAAP